MISNDFSVDNSDYMRNGDFIPSRMQAQQEAINLVCHSKTRSNPENNVGLISLAKYSIDIIPYSSHFEIRRILIEFFWHSRVEVLTTLTTDVGKILAKLHHVQPSGDINFLTGMRIAHVSVEFFHTVVRSHTIDWRALRRSLAADS